MKRRKRAARSGKYGRSIVLKKKKKECLEVVSESDEKGVSFGEEGDAHYILRPMAAELLLLLLNVSLRTLTIVVIPCRGTEDGKGAGINSGKSGPRNLEAECIRSRA